MYKRRVAIFLGIIALAFLALLGRLLDMQVLHGSEARAQFDDSLDAQTVLPTMRGEIVDRNGIILARDEPCFEFCLQYELMANEPRWVARQVRAIAKARGVDRERAQAFYATMRDNAMTMAAEVCGSEQARDEAIQEIVSRVQKLISARKEPPQEATQLHRLALVTDEKLAWKLKGAIDDAVGAAVRPASRRIYPLGDVACHVIGSTGAVDERERERYNLTDDQADRLTQRLTNYDLSDVIGKSGVEKLCEAMLRGRRGYRTFRKDTQESRIEPSQPGKTVQVTLDSDLQRELAEVFRTQQPGKNGSIVVMDLRDNSILAMVSVPTYDLNEYRKLLPAMMQDKENRPLLHRCVGGLYPPGSTAKPMTAVAGLSTGVIDSGTSVFCDGSLFDPTQGYTCTGQHGWLSVVAGLQHSCNIFFYTLGERLQHQRPGELMRYFGLFGMLDRAGTGLPEERKARASFLPAKENQQRSDEIQARMLGIGQGSIDVTPLHVANEMATIAHGGTFLSPVIVREGGPPRVERDLKLRPQDVALVQEGMHQVTSAPGGTAYKVFRDAHVGFEVCGKSGTAQVEPKTKGNMVWFSGFAPYRNPQVAFVVLVEYVQWADGGGATISGPIAVDVLKACQRRGYIK